MPLNQIYLFTGENTYMLRQKKQRWVGEFEKKHGDQNLLTIDASDVQMRDLLDEVAAAPFLSSKRLVVVMGIPKIAKEDVELLGNSIHPDCILLFVEPKPDKRLGGTKELLKQAQVEEFALLKGAALQKWMQQYAAELGATLIPDAQKALMDLFGSDQEFLAQEIYKLSLFTEGKSIQSDDVETLSLCSAEKQVWQLMDLLGGGDMRQVFAFTNRLIHQGENAHGLWNMFLWMMSNLVPVTSAVQQGQTNPAAIAKQTGVNFMSVRSILPLVRQLPQKQLRTIIDTVTEYDIALKTGGFKATVDEPQELHVVLDRTLIACCSRS